jgi:hypothetical protein
MMNGILAICLTLVFAGWVWYLKQQVAEMTCHVAAPAGGPTTAPAAARRHVHLVHAQRAHQQAEPRRREEDPAPRRGPVRSTPCVRKGGIPTWTITV